MSDIASERVIAFLARRRGDLDSAGRVSLLEACRDEPGGIARHLEALGVTRACASSLVDLGTRIARRAASVAGDEPLLDPSDRTLRQALRAGVLDHWTLCAGLVDHACGGPPLAEVAAAGLARGEMTVETRALGEVERDRATVLLTRTDADAPRARDLPPMPADAPRIGRYAVTGRLGEGGMGEVLAVVDADLDREVAAKVIRGHADERQMWKFVLEARVTGRLAHPSIVPVYELGRTSEGQLYFTMKRIVGRTLTSVLADVVEQSDRGRDAPFTARLIERLGIVRKVCDAVAFAHSQGVIHRDLKPDNVMVGEFGEVLVCDWGLAKIAGEGPVPDRALDALVPVEGAGGAVVTLDGDVMGTPAYMPPEQAEGRVELVDERADVYALGAILYQALCGRPPYEGTTAWSVVEQVRAGPPPSPTERVALGAAIPWELEVMTAKAMARRRGDRYASVVALRDDVDAFLAGRLLAAARYSPVERLSKWARRHARALAATGVALASLVGALGYSVIAARRQVRELEDRDALTRAAERVAQGERATAQRERDAAQVERDAARASYAEARRMGALHRVRELEREALDELWWTRLDRTTGRLRDLPTAARLAVVERAIVRWIDDAGALLDARADHAIARDAGRAEAEASPTDSWLSFRAGILAELCTALDRLVELRVRARDRALEYEGMRVAHGRRAAEWAVARAAIADNPRYRGLQLEPQVGLVPLGEDPTSGLWEFGVVGSGEVPARVPRDALPIGDRTGVVLVLIPGGTYAIGAQPAGGRHRDPDAAPNEGPEHEVEVRPFLVARTELTQHQWVRMGGINSSRRTPGTQLGHVLVTERHPVESASWDDTAVLLARHGLELPSEVQWEVAARGGRATPWWTGADPTTLSPAENLADACARRFISGLNDVEAWDDGHFLHAPVATFAAGRNPFGLYDVHGNVREWCRDAFDLSAYTRAADAEGDRAGPAGDPHLRAARGGSWVERASFSRSSKRFGIAPAFRDGAVGARPVRRIAP